MKHLLTDNQTGKIHLLTGEALTILGRDSRRADIGIDFDGLKDLPTTRPELGSRELNGILDSGVLISRVHASVKPIIDQDGRPVLVVQDLGSTNGTYILAPKENFHPYHLKRNETVNIYEGFSVALGIVPGRGRYAYTYSTKE